MNRNMKIHDIEDIFEDNDDKICQNNPRSNPEASGPMESGHHAKAAGGDPGSQSHLFNILDCI